VLVHLIQVIGEAATGLSEEIKKIAKSKPAERDVPFSARSLSKLAEFPVAEVLTCRSSGQWMHRAHRCTSL
jgi:hypothetical protein